MNMGGQGSVPIEVAPLFLAQGNMKMAKKPQTHHKKTKGRKLLIDGDLLLYRFAFARHKVIKWDADTRTDILDPEGAIADLDDFIAWLDSTLAPKDLIVYVSSDWNFRYKVLPTYKHNRAETERPKLYDDLKTHLLDTYPTLTIKWLEADDLLGIYGSADPDGTVVASIDKDLLQVPGLHFNWKSNQLIPVNQEQGDRWFFRQTLTGDSTDGYSGCPSIGPKRAETFLEEVMPTGMPYSEQAVWDAIVEVYASKGLTAEDALQQARVARILRNTEFNFDTKEYSLWLPR